MSHDARLDALMLFDALISPIIRKFEIPDYYFRRYSLF